MSFMKDCQGVKGMASPKHPHDFTNPNTAEAKVKMVKKTIISNSKRATIFTLKATNIATPRTISRMQTKEAIGTPSEINQSQFMPNSTQYSSNLYENPSGSLALIRPENMKSVPTIILQNPIIKCFII
jgi:hypothetical protein